MSLPRPIFRGQTYMITRRCTQRQFLLLPSALCRQVFAYCLAYAQWKTGMLLHAAMVLSNHNHNVLTDPGGRLPQFTYILNKYVGKCMNAHYGRWENFWAANEQTSHVVLADDEAKLDKMAYTMANPVEAGLVRRYKDWPGYKLLQPGKYKVKRPPVFFAEDGDMPETLTLEITPVPLESEDTARAVMERVNQAIFQREAELRAKRKEQGLGYLGLKRILAQSHLDTPTSRAPRRKMSPRLATKNKWRRIEVLQRLKDFVVRYREALARWLAGDREVLFPAGTYQLKGLFGVKCEPACGST